MREISFKYGSREKGWKHYNCTEKESNWDKERESLYGLGGVLEDKRVDPGDQKLTRRYWITL